MAGKSYFKLVSRRERWGLTLIGWLLLVLTIGALAAYCFLHAYTFLAVTERAPGADTLVVEGWVPRFTIVAAVDEFKSGSYARALATGGPISGEGGYINDFHTSASLGANNLKAAGLPSENVAMVPSRVSKRDRTYASAEALRDWFHEQGLQVKAFNIVTENTHARRTQLLFQDAFGNEAKVGVIAVANPDYDAERWWKTSEGVKNVVEEGIAYLYVKLLFHPADENEPAKK